MATIGTILVNVVADAAGFEHGIKKAEGMLGGFKQRLAAAKAVAGTGSGAFLQAAGGMLPGVAMGAVGAAAGFLAGAVHGAVDSIKEYTREAWQSVPATAKMADQLGIAFETFRGLEHGAKAAGLGPEEFALQLTHLQRELGQATIDGSDAAKGFKALGLAGDELAQLPLDQSLARIADYIKELPTPAERAAAEFQLFGRSGQDMDRFLRKGSEGMAEMAEHTRTLMGELSRADAAGIQQANRGFGQMKSILEGIGQRIAAAIAPALAAVYEWVASWINAKSVIGKAISFLIDMVKSLAEWVARILMGSEWLEEFKRKNEEAARAQEMLSRQMEKGLALQKLRADMADFTADLEKQIKTFGMAAEKAKLYDLLRRGVSQKDYLKGLQLADELNDLREAKKVIDDIQSPLDKLRERAGTLESLFGRGKLTQDQLDKARGKLFQDFNSAAGNGGERKTAGAMVEGSKEALETVLRSRMGGNVQDRIEEGIRLLNEQAKAQVENGRRLVELLRDPQPQVVKLGF
jgi:hypothetical protein